jgi:hypothetical protein
MGVKIISVFSGSFVEANSLRHNLESEGIKVLLKNHDAAAVSFGFVNITRPSVALCIFEVDVEKARSIVEEFMKTLA